MNIQSYIYIYIRLLKHNQSYQSKKSSDKIIHRTNDKRNNKKNSSTLDMNIEIDFIIQSLTVTSKMHYLLLA